MTQQPPSTTRCHAGVPPRQAFWIRSTPLPARHQMLFCQSAKPHWQGNSCEHSRMCRHWLPASVGAPISHPIGHAPRKRPSAICTKRALHKTAVPGKLKPNIYRPGWLAHSPVASCKHSLHLYSASKHCNGFLFVRATGVTTLITYELAKCAIL